MRSCGLASFCSVCKSAFSVVCKTAELDFKNMGGGSVVSVCTTPLIEMSVFDLPMTGVNFLACSTSEIDDSGVDELTWWCSHAINVQSTNKEYN